MTSATNEELAELKAKLALQKAKIKRLKSELKATRRRAEAAEEDMADAADELASFEPCDGKCSTQHYHSGDVLVYHKWIDNMRMELWDDAEIAGAATRALARLGMSASELKSEGELGRFSSPATKRVWYAYSRYFNDNRKMSIMEDGS